MAATLRQLVVRICSRDALRRPDVLSRITSQRPNITRRDAEAAFEACLERGEIELAYTVWPEKKTGGKPARYYRAVTPMDQFLRMRLRRAA